MAFPPRPKLPDEGLVFDFFWTFSTIECAMKHAGIFKVREGSDAIEADWERFAAELVNHGTERSQNFLKAARGLQRFRVQRFQLVENRPEWKPFERGRMGEVEFTLHLLRLVRNNLFHGGKYEFGAPADQVERDTAIIRAALSVLDQCFEHHPRVKVEVEQVAAA
jgi:hypothetical protein